MSPPVPAKVGKKEGSEKLSLHERMDHQMKKARSESRLYYKEPVGIFYPNEQGQSGYEPDVPMKDLMEFLPEAYRITKKKIKEDISDFYKSLDRAELYEPLWMQDGEVRIEYRFDTQEEIDKWKTGSDSAWNEGFSTCELVPTQNNTVLFRGRLDSRIPMTGHTERAGWAAFKYSDRRSFNRKRYFTRWQNFTHIVIKCRGDGRTYKVNLSTPMHFDVTWGDLHSFYLHTHGGPYWQIAKIPFSKLVRNVYGRIQDRQHRVPHQNVSSLGIAIMDRIDGEFSLEVDWIGVYNDTSHHEKFAYENYIQPIISPVGI
uniref:NADH:ubiquinone oxidoreductase intermediate-associated protein 30 domain-containing protein n=1 Tax=Plectus sambesii TaxID=2011161 RepID=A0A914WXC6_9BILA